MATLRIKVGNARREPLDDEIDVHVVATRTDATVARLSRVRGTSEIRIEGLAAGDPYLVKVFPARHRAVAQFAIPRESGEAVAELFAPLDPEHVHSVRFPPFAALPADLQRVLACSTVEGIDGCGAALYDALIDAQRAGLLNLFAKMSTVGFDPGRTVWSFIDAVYRVRPDRIFADVQPALRDLVKGAVGLQRFREVSGKLHTPPAGFALAGSYKTTERYGNLQLSFFASEAAPLRFRVDADIDDAAGLGHVFQVLRNAITDGTTHPYDVHQILTFRQEVALPYDLA